MSLNARQEAFVEHYVVDRNAKQAAIRAGYSEKTAHSAGPRLLQHVGVARAINRKLSKVTKSAEITAEKILALAYMHAQASPGSPGSVKATELLMKYQGMLIERSESGKPGDFASDMTPEQRETKILELQARRRKAG